MPCKIQCEIISADVDDLEKTMLCDGENQHYCGSVVTSKIHYGGRQDGTEAMRNDLTCWRVNDFVQPDETIK
jgi:hypothetical protein